MLMSGYLRMGGMEGGVKNKTNCWIQDHVAVWFRSVVKDEVGGERSKQITGVILVLGGRLDAGKSTLLSELANFGTKVECTLYLWIRGSELS